MQTAGLRVLKQEKGTENVLGLTLDMRMLEKEKLHGSLELKTDALKAKANDWIVLKRQKIAWFVEDS
ncbi:unnamed protein product [Lactuca virosa]|uniref:Uncharacterized protein n=1 Tax=Lactuca virosa TaxID=75947 RepID=A0AAU9NRQ3_9ASTR|nr:unnamed protein product [Lactuca virosa]